ncbi:Sialate O-acetylesterase [Hondaea fermentalgiana]|uniref:Sialate O-acetylesterase n=1 Tax=Hondaea fermentalgiana TaxID=2315210 RepID=A0A2R5GHF3_9STRA|nr:Sialate O-acetylesterase [Hondaea fermentalgiana]|eukprot:GBG30336.1 Sialate O-acetylesterase [Hondaea fermentalgiana]
MVLQRAPKRAVVYGPLATRSDAQDALIRVVRESDEVLLHESAVDIAQGGQTWRHALPPFAPHGDTGFRIELISGSAGNVSLHNVAFGDVWFCSGQSNMALGIKNTFSFRTVRDDLRNATFAGQNGSLLRILGVTLMPNSPAGHTSAQPDYIMRKKMQYDRWQQLGAESKALMALSSTCIYFGLELRRKLAGSEETRNLPIGLIFSAIGGTQVQRWSPRGTLDGCADISRSETDADLFNGLVAPFVNTTITGAIWYQGENNVREVAGSIAQKRGYACSLHQMVDAWRSLWAVTPGTTSAEFPFVIYSLAGGTDEGKPENMAAMRSAQMEVANALPNVAIAHGHDLGEPWPNQKACVKAGCCVPSTTAMGDFKPQPDCINARPRKMLPSYWFEAIDGEWLYGAAPVYMGLIHPRNKRRFAARAVLAVGSLAYNFSEIGQLNSPRAQQCVKSSSGRLALALDELAKDDALVIEPESSRVLPDANIEFCTGARASCLCRVWRKDSTGSRVCDDHAPGSKSRVSLHGVEDDFKWHTVKNVSLGTSRTSLILDGLSRNEEIHAVRVAWSTSPCCASSAAYQHGQAPYFKVTDGPLYPPIRPFLLLAPTLDDADGFILILSIGIILSISVSADRFRGHEALGGAERGKMGVAGDNEQSTGSPGFLFCVIFAPIVVVVCFTWIIIMGRRGNDYFAYAPDMTWKKTVLAWRVAIAVFYLVTIGYEFDSRDVWELQYYTVWNLVILTLYFLVATAVSLVLVFAPSQAPLPVTKGMRAERQPNIGIKMLWIVHQTLGELEWCTSILVAIVVWAFIAPNAEPEWSPYLGFTSISEHACNIVVMTIDFFLSGYLINFTHWSLSVFWPALYLCWHLGGNVAYGFMAYPFLRTNDVLSIAYVIVLAIVSFVIFCITYGFSVAKRKCFSRYSVLVSERLRRASASQRLRESDSDESADSDPKRSGSGDPENGHLLSQA